MIRGIEVGGIVATVGASLFSGITLQDWNALIVPAIVGILTICMVGARTIAVLHASAWKRRREKAETYEAEARATRERMTACKLCIECRGATMQDCPFDDSHAPRACPKNNLIEPRRDI